MGEYSLVKDCVVITMVEGKLIYQPLLRFEGQNICGPTYEPESPGDMVSVFREGRDAISARGGLKKLNLGQIPKPVVAEPAKNPGGMREQAITHDSKTGQELPPPKDEEKKDRGGGPRTMRG